MKESRTIVYLAVCEGIFGEENKRSGGVLAIYNGDFKSKWGCSCWRLENPFPESYTR